MVKNIEILAGIYIIMSQSRVLVENYTEISSPILGGKIGEVLIFRSTVLILGRLRRVDLITWVRFPSVRPSTKSFSDSNEIWYAGRGR